MNVMPRMMKVCTILCTALFSLSFILAPTAPAWAFVDVSLNPEAEMLAMTSIVAETPLTDTDVDALVGDLENPTADDSLDAPAAAMVGNIQLNAPCLGITSTATYLGVWKNLGSNKAKCKEGAGGALGGFISRTKCRIVPISGPVIDNAIIVGNNKCEK